MEYKFDKLHELCRQNKLKQQKAWALGIVLFGIGLQAFSGEVLFFLFTAGIMFIGFALFFKDHLVEEEGVEA